jgi:hypothetical protein
MADNIPIRITACNRSAPLDLANDQLRLAGSMT